MISSGQAKEVLNILDTNRGVASLKGSVKLRVKDAEGREVDVHDIANWGGDDDGVIDNQTLDTAKIIFSKLAAGQTEYKIAKIMFGNAGHDFTNTKVAVPATSADVELNAISHIRSSLSQPATSHFLYNDGTTDYRMSVVEKDITSSHITFGNGDQFVVRVPVNFDDFNLRTGLNQDDAEALFDDNAVAYDFLDASNEIISVRNVNASGAVVNVPTVPLDATGTVAGNASEVNRYDDGTTITYNMLNGIDATGVVNTSAGGVRPQEISEILLSAAITEEDGVKQKYATSRMTSGLLVFPQGFEFTYEWTLTWTFA